MRRSRSGTTPNSAHHERSDDFSALVDALPDLVFVHLRGKLLYVNEAVLDTLGYTGADELVGRDVVDTLVAPSFAELVRRCVDQEPALRDAEVECRHRDGHTLYLQGRSAPLMFEGTDACVVVARDVTAQRKLNERVLRTERMASVGTLAAGVAHEINNPLAAVMANLEYLINEVREMQGSSPNARLTEMEEVISDARLAADRIRRIVRGMRVFSRPDDERLMVVELPGLLDCAIEMTQHLIRHRGRLVKDVQILPAVKGDETQICTVFISLITNAADAIADRPPAKNEVRISAHTDERGRAVIEVRDNGNGIPAEVQRRMFDPFFTTKPVGSGTGLGLSVAHAVVTGMGGHIECESEPGKGSLFRVILPPADDKLRATEPPTSASRLTRARVLVIDDEPQVGTVLRRLLGKEHHVDVFEDASEALEHVLAGATFDVAFCDLMMPGLSGEEFYRVLADKLPALAEKVVFITGGAFTTEARRFLDQVPNQRLDKPFDGQQIRAMVRAALRGRRSRTLDGQ